MWQLSSFIFESLTCNTSCRKAKKWESSLSHTEAAGEWGPEKYFEEKWTHTTGRLSDYTPPKEESAGSGHPSRSAHCVKICQ